MANRRILSAQSVSLLNTSTTVFSPADSSSTCITALWRAGVKGLAQGLNLLYAQLFQHGHELLADHLHTLAVGVPLLELGQAPLQVVQHLQKGFTVSALASPYRLSFSLAVRLR